MKLRILEYLVEECFVYILDNGEEINALIEE